MITIFPSQWSSLPFNWVLAANGLNVNFMCDLDVLNHNIQTGSGPPRTLQTLLANMPFLQEAQDSGPNSQQQLFTGLSIQPQQFLIRTNNGKTHVSLTTQIKFVR